MISRQTEFSRDVLKLDEAAESLKIEASIRQTIFERLRKKGAVVALSGGIDSSVVAALCCRALGRERVLGLFLPEDESASESLTLGRMLAEHLGICTATEDIGPILRAAGCYRRRDDAIRQVVPAYGDGAKCKIVLSGILDGPGYQIYSVVIRMPDGQTVKARLTPEAVAGIVAATSFKQRTRKMMEYYYADLLAYAVSGTPNRLEYDQGFFVKNGDGAADFKPIAHLYKTQVYDLARYLDIPAEIQSRPPTTDTFPLDQSQEEFYFSLPYDKLDLLLYACNHGVAPTEAAPAAGLTPEQVQRTYSMIASKRRFTGYLHLPPILVEEVFEVAAGKA